MFVALLVEVIKYCHSSCTFDHEAYQHPYFIYFIMFSSYWVRRLLSVLMGCVTEGVWRCEETGAGWPSCLWSSVWAGPQFLVSAVDTSFARRQSGGAEGSWVFENSRIRRAFSLRNNSCCGCPSSALVWRGFKMMTIIEQWDSIVTLAAPCRAKAVRVEGGSRPSRAALAGTAVAGCVDDCMRPLGTHVP